MDQLWKKESRRFGALYVDCFESIDAEFIEDVTNWLLAFEKLNKSKHNEKSDVHLQIGERQMQKMQWKNAFNSFNRSLCLAANGSKNVEAAYIRRAECLYHLQKTSESYTNEEMGVTSEPAAKKRKLNNANTSPKPKKQPSLSFEGHHFLPDMANVLEIEENEKYGRHIVAKRKIEVGKIIVAAQPFARVCIPKAKETFCLTCHKTDVKLIPCEQCTDAHFCDQNCLEANLTHPLECNTIFHQIANCQVKLTVQCVLNTIKTFGNSDDLINHFEKLFDNAATSRFELLLKFHKILHDNTVLRAYRAFKCLMSIPIVKAWFHSKKKQRFLMHLTLHYMLIVPANSFRDQLHGGSEVQYIFDCISLFNHSCAPNAFYRMKNNTAYLVTIRPIKKREQVFFNYLGDFTTDSNEERKFYIKSNWDFDCECERCVPSNQLNTLKRKKIVDNATLRYIDKYDDDHKLPFGSARRLRLQEKCVKFMNECGFVWSKHLQYVADVFILCCTE